MMKKIFMMLTAASLMFMGGCTEEKQDPDAEQPSDTVFLSQETVSVDNSGGPAEVVVTSSGDWRMSGGAEWSVPSAVEGKSGDKITFEIAPNDTDADREARYKIFTGSAVAELTIRNVAGYVMELTSDAGNSLTVEESVVYIRLKTNIPADELDLSFTDRGNEWISCESTTEVFGTVVMKMKVLANPGYAPRSSVLTISGHDLSATVDFSQDQVDLLSVPEDDLLHEFDENGGSFSISVSHNIGYTVGELPEWIQQDGEIVSSDDRDNPGLKTDIISYKVLESDEPMRNCTIVIKDDVDGTMSFNVGVSQLNESIETGTIPDRNLRIFLESDGWIEFIDPANNSDQVIINPEDVIDSESDYYPMFYPQIDYAAADIQSMQGIEYFPNITSVNVSNNARLAVVDISGLHNVTGLVQVQGCSILETVLFGDNTGSLYMSNATFDAECITVTGTAITTITAQGAASYVSYSGPAALDISGCPAMATVDLAKRYGVKTIYLTAEQKSAYESGSLTITFDADRSPVELVVK